MQKSHLMMWVLAISAIAATNVQARDSFSLGINVGGYGYAPPVVYYASPPVYLNPPPVVYYPAPTRFYPAPAREYYYAPPPAVSFSYFNGGHSLHHEGGHYCRNHGGRSLHHEGGNYYKDRGRHGRGGRDHD
jgi:hypothetical protein